MEMKTFKEQTSLSGDHGKTEEIRTATIEGTIIA